MLRFSSHFPPAAAAFILLALLTAAPALAGPPLLVPAEDARERVQPADRLVLRERRVRVDLYQLSPGARTVTVPLFGSAAVEILLERREATRGEGFVWIGKIAGQPQSLVIFSVLEGVLVADIRSQRGELYQIRFLGDGVHVLRQINPMAYPPEAEPGEVELSASDPSKTSGACPMTDPPDEIDAMIVYTPAARIAAGGAIAIEAEADLAVTTANTTYLNSGINQHLRLVHVAEVPYTETAGMTNFAMTQDRDRLQAKGDSHLDHVHTLRDVYGADVVALFGEYPVNYPLCGIAFIMTSVTTSFESDGFAVVQRSCASGNMTFAHELGHIMGARHEWTADPANNSPFAFNHGYFYSLGVWRTVMATVNAGNGCCNRIPYWSNPNQTYNGVATGVGGSQPTDNRQSLNLTAATVANFRCSSPLVGQVFCGIKGADWAAMVAAGSANLIDERGSTKVTITGTKLRDLILGNGLNNKIDGHLERDCIYGYNGSDQINGSSGSDTIYGGSGDDSINGGIDDDTIFGEDGADTIDGGRGTDRLHGGNGNDRIDGNLNDDIVLGGDGNDTIRGGSGNDTILGETGDDRLEGKEGADTVDGGPGRDKLKGDSGPDVLRGGTGDDFLLGDAQGDDLYGDRGNDRLCGNSGADDLDGGVGTDRCRGGGGGDQVNACEPPTATVSQCTISAWNSW